MSASGPKALEQYPSLTMRSCLRQFRGPAAQQPPCLCGMQAMYAIRTRLGDVYFELEDRGGDVSCFQVGSSSGALGLHPVAVVQLDGHMRTQVIAWRRTLCGLPWRCRQQAGAVTVHLCAIIDLSNIGWWWKED